MTGAAGRPHAAPARTRSSREEKRDPEIAKVKGCRRERNHNARPPTLRAASADARNGKGWPGARSSVALTGVRQQRS